MHHVDGLNANAALSAAFRVYQKALHSELLCIVPWCLVTSYECFTFLWLDVALCPEVTYIAAMNATIFTWSVKFFCVLQACGTRIFMEVHGERIVWGLSPSKLGYPTRLPSQHKTILKLVEYLVASSSAAGC